MRRMGLLCVAATIVASGGCSDTEGSGAPASDRRPGAVGAGGAGANLRSDDDFVQDVAIKNMTAIELSRLAVGKAGNSDIKSFAQVVMGDADAAGQKLKSAAATATTSWPAQLDDAHRKTVEDLAAKHGVDFDREYVEAMIDGYQDLTAKLESRLDVQSLAEWKTAVAGRAESKALPEPSTALHDVKLRPNRTANESSAHINQWAADTYPVAQKRLDAARTLQNAIKER